MQSAALLSVSVVALAWLPPPTARAEPSGRPTPLLSDDILAGKRTRIDDGGADAGLDPDIEKALGGGAGFSTKELERVEDRLRADMKRERPRATPKLIVFLYPGRMDSERLRSLSEVLVDMEIQIDPCERSVCREAVGKEIESVGRAIGKPVLATPNWRLAWKTLTLKVITLGHGDEVDVYKISIADCISAAGRPGGGLAWVDNQKKSDEEYEPIVTKAITKEAQSRRVALAGVPSVVRQGKSVTVGLHVKGDRSRVDQQVLDALSSAAAGLRQNPATPQDQRLEVAVDVRMKSLETRKFRSPGQPIGLYLDGRLDADTLRANYIAEIKKEAGAQEMSFDDNEARGRAPGGGPEAEGEGMEPDDNKAIAVISANFASLRECVQAEVARKPGFRGVTLVFKWTPAGKAEGTVPKEPGLKGSPVARCLAQAMDAMRLPRFSGSPREIEYPILLK